MKSYRELSKAGKGVGSPVVEEHTGLFSSPKTCSLVLPHVRKIYVSSHLNIKRHMYSKKAYTVNIVRILKGT